MADSTLSNLTSLTLPSQATDLLLVGRGTARPNKVAMSDALNSAALAATTTAYGVVLLAPNGGTTAGTVVQANDSRLTGGGGGVTSLAGTANQISVSAATGAVTLSLPSTLTAPGTLSSNGNLTAGNGSSAIEVRAVGDSTAAYGYTLYTGGTYEASLRHTATTGLLKLDVGRNSTWGGAFEIYADTTRAARFTKTAATIDGTLTLGSYLQTGGYARINGLTAGTNTYLQLWNGASTIGLLGSRASIDGGAAADVGLYVYGANNLTFWTNSAIAATVSSNGNLLIGGTTDISGNGGLKVFGTTNSTSAITGALIVGNGTNGGIGVSGRSYFAEQVNSKAFESTGGPTVFDANGGISLAGNGGSAYAAIKAYTNAAGTEKTISFNQSGGAGVNIGGTGAVEGGGLRVGSIMAVGTATDVSIGLNHRPTLTTGSFQYGVYSSPSINAATADAGFFSMRTAAASAVGSAFLLRAFTPTLGASSTITNAFGLRIENIGATGVTNAYGIDIAAQSGASTTNVGLRNAGTTFLSDTYITAPNGFHLDTGGSASLRWDDAGVSKWWLYKLNGDINIYLRDMVNARMQATFNPGASSGAATTYFWSNLYVDSTVNSTSYNSGALQVAGGVGIGGALYSQQNSNAIVTGTNFANVNAGTAATLRHTLTAGTNTSTIEAYSNGHATFPGRLRFGTTNGQMDFVPSGVLGLSISASAVTTPVGLINISKSGAGSTLEINADSGFTSKLSFQRATTNRWTMEVDSTDLLSIKALGSTTALSITGAGAATFSSLLTANGGINVTTSGFTQTLTGNEIHFSRNSFNYVFLDGGTSANLRFLGTTTTAGDTGILNLANTQVAVLPTTNSSSKITGALVIGDGTNGGLGVSGAINTGGDIKVTRAAAANTGYSVVNTDSGGSPGLYLEGDAGEYAIIRRGGSTYANPRTVEYVATGSGARHLFNTTSQFDGTLIAAASTNAFRIPTAQTPASQTASGTQGQITWDASYLYVCTSTNNWGRSSLNWAGGGGGSLSPWSTKTSAYTAANGDRLLADTSGGAFTITLPSSPSAGHYIEINDPEETWATNNLTVARNGSNIDSLAENLVCNITAKIGLTYIDATIGWKVDFIAELGGGTNGTKTYDKFTPLNNQPPASAFATLDTRNSVAVLDFDDGATNESSIFVSVLPEAAVVSSGLKVRIHWMATSATSGNCRWGAQFADLSDQDIDSYAFDTATEVGTATSGTSGNVTVTEITCTSIDSITAGKPYAIKVYRDSSDTTNDTMTGDAELVAVEIRSAV